MKQTLVASQALTPMLAMVKSTTPEGTPVVPPATVTEDDLLKSLKTLEGKVEEEPTQEAPTTVSTAPLAKSVETVTAGMSPAATQAMNASPFLKELVTLLGGHVDTALGGLQKSIQGSADRDLAFAGILTDMKKSLDTVIEKVDAYGKEPTAPAGARPVTTTEAPLDKSIQVTPTKVDPADPVQVAALRKSVLSGLESLVRRSEDPQEQRRLATVTAKFESTNQITELDMNKALKEVKGA